jgi:hypothetical protein
LVLHLALEPGRNGVGKLNKRLRVTTPRFQFV